MTASYINITSNGSSYYVTGTSTGSSSTSSTWVNTSAAGTATTTGLVVSGGNSIVIDAVDRFLDGDIQVRPNSRLILPDGHVIEVDANGNFTILDDDAIVTYKGNNVREFNKFINASDLLESFIGDLGVLGVKQDEVLNVPIEIFINWLIFKAAEQDGDDIPQDVPQLESSVTQHKHPKCLCCGKFIKKTLVEHKIHFCNPDHHEQYLKRIGI